VTQRSQVQGPQGPVKNLQQDIYTRGAC